MKVALTTLSGEGAKEWLTDSILSALGKTEYSYVMTEKGYEKKKSIDLVPDISIVQIKKEIIFKVNGDLITGIWKH